MPKKFMRKVLVSPSMEMENYHVWVEDQGDDKATLAMVKKEILANEDVLMDDATLSVNVGFTECVDKSMSDQVVTKDDGWCTVADLRDKNGKVEPTSDKRYLDPDYEQSAWYREELEKAGQQKLNLGGKGDAD